MFWVELLVIKVVLEEWRQTPLFLEGADKPFIVWTNHNNIVNPKKLGCFSLVLT